MRMAVRMDMWVMVAQPGCVTQNLVTHPQRHLGELTLVRKDRSCVTAQLFVSRLELLAFAVFRSHFANVLGVTIVGPAPGLWHIVLVATRVRSSTEGHRRRHLGSRSTAEGAWLTGALCHRHQPFEVVAARTGVVIGWHLTLRSQRYTPSGAVRNSWICLPS